jgi:hypothetical protein
MIHGNSVKGISFSTSFIGSEFESSSRLHRHAYTAVKAADVNSGNKIKQGLLRENL